MEKRQLLPFNERRMSLIVFVLFSAWMLALPFEGQILYAVAREHDLDPHKMVFRALAAMAAGLVFWGLFTGSKKTAKRLILSCTALSLFCSTAFFYPPTYLWSAALIASSFFIAAGIVGWSYYFKSGTPKRERIITAAAGLIISNILMIVLNMAAIHLSPYLGLAAAMLLLGASFFFALLLPSEDAAHSALHRGRKAGATAIAKPLAVLYLFIFVITIDSGLMYHVLNPSFMHLEWLSSWYWALPYIAGLYVMMKLSRKVDRNHILYVAIAAIGLSFIAFMVLDRSASSYLVVNTLMLGACGVCDLFWWSILGETLDLSEKPARIFGAGLAANVAGVLGGGILGDLLAASWLPDQNTAAIALAIICVTLIILPSLYRYLSILLEDHAFNALQSAASPGGGQDRFADCLARLGKLSEREKQVALLLLQGKTYKKIAGELHVSENTIKTHVRNIYSKLDIQSRGELIDQVLKESVPGS